MAMGILKYIAGGILNSALTHGEEEFDQFCWYVPDGH